MEGGGTGGEAKGGRGVLEGRCVQQPAAGLAEAC